MLLRSSRFHCLRMSGLTGSKLLSNRMFWTLPWAMYCAIGFAGRVVMVGTSVGAGNDAAGSRRAASSA